MTASLISAGAIMADATAAPSTAPSSTATTTAAPNATAAIPVSVSVNVPAKTNLTLHVGHKRAEWGGRHELDTTYCALGVYDTITVATKAPGTGFSLDLTGAHLGNLASSGSDMRRNHAVLALFALAEECGREPDVSIRIDKRIPVAAGLAGGSADAAGTLLAVNTLWGLNWPVSRLARIAASLGADMPFCLTGGYAHGTGFGERIESLEPGCERERALRAAGWHGRALIGAYSAELSTPKVYARFDEIGAGDGDDNHLQRAAVDLHPRSGEAIAVARMAGASHAFVSGSGPSVVAFAPNAAVARRIAQDWSARRAVDRIIMTDAPAYPSIHVTQHADVASAAAGV